MLLLYGVYIDLMKYNTRIHRWIGTTFGIHEEEETTLGLTSTGHEAKNYSSYGTPPTLYEAALMMLMTRPFRPKTRFWAAAKRVTHEIQQRNKRLQRRLQRQRQMRTVAKVVESIRVHMALAKPHEPPFFRHMGFYGSFATICTYTLYWTRRAVLVAPRQSTGLHIPSWRVRIPAEDGVLSLIKWCIQAPLLATLHYTVPDCRTARGKKLFMLSFLMSIFWTAVFSYVMVWMVTLIGFTMGIPDSIMGITFLAAGTSIPDAFASLLVSRQGQGDMAIANSIGSNVFDILICLALPWLIQTGMIAPGSIAYINSGGLVWSVVLLFLTIIITIYAIHRSHWFLTRKLGIFLMVVYVFFLVFCSAVEFNLLGYVNPPMCTE
ncbi:unnamed protein product [Ixodes pacificus]